MYQVRTFDAIAEVRLDVCDGELVSSQERVCPAREGFRLHALPWRKLVHDEVLYRVSLARYAEHRQDSVLGKRPFSVFQPNVSRF